MDKNYDNANIVEKAIGKARQIAASRFNKSNVEIPASFRGVSFCFDDFPESAGDAGARMLEDSGGRGTFFACFGLLDQTNSGGRLASLERVMALQRNGHEIGCHTHDHTNASFVSAEKFTASCERNITAAAAHGITLSHFSYPQGGMSPGTKQFIKSHYKTARSIFPGVNQGMCDAHCLKGTPLFDADAPGVYGLIDKTAKEGGWLILYTHDVTASPSPYGVSEKAFQEMISYCASRKLPLITVDRAYGAIGGCKTSDYGVTEKCLAF